MVKSPVLVDVDDVMCNLRPMLCEALCIASGKDIHFSEWTHSRLNDTYEISHAHFVQAMLNHKILERSEPEDDALEALQTLREHGHPVILVTKRGWHPNGESITKQWLVKHNLPYDILRVVPFEGSKLDAYKTFDTEFVTLIDDQPSNLDEARASGIVHNTHLIDRPWNKTNSDHSRYSSLVYAVDNIVGRVV